MVLVLLPQNILFQAEFLNYENKDFGFSMPFRLEEARMATRIYLKGDGRTIK